MVAPPPARWVLGVLHLLPQPLVRLADAWSRRVAQRRRRQRMQRWQRASTGAEAEPPIAYRPKPWRD